MDSLRSRFGNLLAAHRRQRGYTQEQLAAACDLSVETVKKLEGGRVGASFDAVEKLAGALQVDPAELFAMGTTAVTERKALADLVAELAAMSDRELSWVEEIIAVAKRRP